MENGLEVFTLGEHVGEVSHLEFRKGHQQLISQSLDGGALAWEIPSGKLMIMHNNERPSIWNTGLDEMSTQLIGFDRDNFDIVLSGVKNVAATYSSSSQDMNLVGQATISGVNEVALRVGKSLIDGVDTIKGRCIGQVVSPGDPNFRKFLCTDVFKAELTYDNVSLLGRLVLKIPATSGREINTRELLCAKSESATSYASRIINCRSMDVAVQ